MFVILDDSGRYSLLNVWLRRSPENFKLGGSDLKIQGVNTKRRERCLALLGSRSL